MDTVNHAKRIAGLVNVLVEAEREYLRAKLRFTSYARRDAWAERVKVAKRELREYLATQIATSA